MTGLHIHIELNLGTIELRVAFNDQTSCLAIVGANGAGKTTLLRCIIGLHTPSRGIIEVSGHPFLDTEKGVCVPMEDRNIGYLPQASGLFPHMNVLENLAFALDARTGRRHRVHREMALQSLEQWHISHLRHRRTAELSGGERQRVALVRALITEPSLLVLDEPFSALDREARHPIREQLASHLASTLCSVVMVTHDPDDVLILADTILCLDRGKVVRQGAPREVIVNPLHPFLERFVAGMPS
jgi:molybdate transport system ATP-binding protein